MCLKIPKRLAQEQVQNGIKQQASQTIIDHKLGIKNKFKHKLKWMIKPSN